MRDFGLYIVMTNPVLDYETFTQTCVEEGVPMLQLREKHLPLKDLVTLAARLNAITKGSQTRFILNDLPDVARVVGTDGIHLGPEDIPLTDAICICQSDFIYGVSTHSMAEAQTLICDYLAGRYEDKPDYMSFGPIYATPTKEKADTPVGTELLAQVMAIAPLPVVAIGGIFPENIRDVLAAGAGNIAMVRYFTQSKDVNELKSKIRNITQIIKEYAK